MPSNPIDARNEIFGLFKTGWDANAGAYNGSQVPRIFWDGVGQDGEQPQESPWAAVILRHLSGQQASLADDKSRRRFEKTGILTVQVFAPLPDVTQALNLAKVAKDIFEGRETTSGIWFRNVALKEIGTRAAWFQVNVTGEFRYDEWK